MRRLLTPLVAVALVATGCLQQFDDEAFEIGTCNLRTDKGCTQQENCTGLDEPACIDAGDTEAGRACASDDDCARGQLCYEHEGAQRCWNKCSTANESCPDGGVCVAMAGAGAEIYELGLCVPECRPSTGGGCTAGKQCLVAWTPNCAAAGNATEGESCNNTDNRCVPEAVCVGSGEDAVCRLRCEGSGGGVPCPEDGVCAALELETGVSLYGDPGVCLPQVDCDLVTNEGCGEGQGCLTDVSGVRGCYTAGTFGPGFACEAASECTANAFCVSGQCVQRCDPEGNKGEPCPDDKSCVQLTDPETGAPLETFPGACAP
jgi:hypothetical protein